MPEMPSGDPYVENILEKVPPSVARTLTREQWDGLRYALKNAHQTTRHFLDLRFILPLYFTRIYCVLILGKDTRQRVEHVLFERRKRAGMILGAAILAIGLVILAAVALVILYIVKSAAGIDLLPGLHFRDWWDS